MKDYTKTLTAQSYYNFSETDNVIRSELANTNYVDVPLRMNCCGVSRVDTRFSENYIKTGRRNYYFLCVVEGKMSFSFDGISFSELNRGSAVLMDKDTPFVFHNHGNEDTELVYIWIHFSGNDVTRTVLGSEIKFNSFMSLMIDDELLDPLERIFSLCRLPLMGASYRMEIAIRNLLVALGELSNLPRISRLDKSIRYIHQKLKKEITLEELAAMEFLGVSRYRELFKETTGMSPGVYITEQRMNKARRFLSQSDLSIAEVSARVGYSDRLYFQRVFRKYVGVTPGEYRKLSE
jgi:AraC-like DNA-binding protein/mannose-6-phosphate isomerase-like protein (cupin superfamily)